MIFKVYKMYPKIIQGHVFMGTRAPDLKLEIDTQDKCFLEYMRQHDSMPLEPDIYFVVNIEHSEYYMLWNENNYWYFDGAYYNDRLIIATELDLTRDQARVWTETDGIGIYCEYIQQQKSLTAKERLAKVFPDYF